MPMFPELSHTIPTFPEEEQYGMTFISKPDQLDNVTPIISSGFTPSSEAEVTT